MLNSSNSIDKCGELVSFLSSVFSDKMLMSDRYELIDGILCNLVKEICNTVTDWSNCRPKLPFDSVKIIHAVENILLSQSKCDGVTLNSNFKKSLRVELNFGHYCFVNDIY